MENILKKDYKIPVSLCDSEAKLSVPSVFSLFMDMASEHAKTLNLGMDVLLKKNLIWVAAKTKFVVHRYPQMLSDVSLATWPEAPGSIRYNRYYTVSDQDGVMIEGKSEWTIIDLTTGRPQKSADVYPQDIEHLTDVVCADPFARISTDFSDCEKLCDYLVTSRDIDASHHMNNVAYIRAVLSTMTCEELNALNIRGMEVAYRTQCFEGETLSIYKRMGEEFMDIGVLKSDGKAAAVIRISL